ncbi:CHAP domain-containing protein [Actinomadura hibisca]|uniref:CHAP domain-containing protein n=1 Tax=Actinomadura hibisca TaxID=68565 RepID=UPI00082EC432|nr:CHAP domain-containing protein [Actinomadura hibisca]
MSGKHRKPTALTLTLRATGTFVAGAAVIGTAATAASATVSVPGQDAPAHGPLASTQLAAAPQQAPAKIPAKAAEKPTGKAAEHAAAGKAAPKKRPTADDAIKMAKSQVGVKENSNGETKYQDWYMTTSRARETVKRDGGSIQGYNDAQWCSMFVSWLGERLDFNDQFGEDAWTVEHARFFQKEGRWGTKPKPGAIVFFAWDGGKGNHDIVHVGMVIKDNGDGTVKTVEGNTGNAVQIKTRNTAQIVGYGYPDYAK